MSEIVLSPVSINSAPAQACLDAYCAELSRRFGRPFASGPEADPGAYAPPRGLFLLALRDGVAVGCVGLRPESPGCVEVKRLWVAPDARGLGLSHRLMAAVEQAARDMGAARLRLDTSRHLPEAIALYRRGGWDEIARYNDNPDADFFFERRL